MRLVDWTWRNPVVGPLAAVADDAAALDVEGRFANGHPRLVLERAGEVHEVLYVGEVTGDAQRDANRSGTLPTAMGDELQEPRQVHIGAERDGSLDVVLGDVPGGLTRTRIT